jgi:hypothetical protein
MWKYVLAWLPMIPIAIGNGVLRESWYGKHVGSLEAHQISTATAIVLFGIYIWLVMRALRPASGRQAIVIGLTWLVLTIAFELLFGHYVVGHSWQSLFDDYDLLSGRLWVLVLAWLAIAPLLFQGLQGGSRRG